jgi:hypothetical protein
VTGQPPTGGDPFGSHPGRHGHGAGEGDTTPGAAGHQRGHQVVAQCRVRRCRQSGKHAVVLYPGEGCGQASAGHDLEDRGEVPELETRTTESGGRRDAIEACLGKRAPMTVRDFPGRIDIEGGGEQNLVGDLARPVHQRRGHGHRR